MRFTCNSLVLGINCSTLPLYSLISDAEKCFIHILPRYKCMHCSKSSRAIYILSVNKRLLIIPLIGIIVHACVLVFVVCNTHGQRNIDMGKYVERIVTV